MPALVALVAALMLVIAGAPLRAAASPCDPCPPDCPMMKQMAAVAGTHSGKASDQGGKTANPCEQGVVCQIAPSVAPAPSAAAAPAALTVANIAHAQLDPLAAPSRPPDRSLRPPIQL